MVDACPTFRAFMCRADTARTKRRPTYAKASKRLVEPFRRMRHMGTWVLCRHAGKVPKSASPRGGMTLAQNVTAQLCCDDPRRGPGLTKPNMNAHCPSPEPATMGPACPTSFMMHLRRICAGLSCQYHTLKCCQRTLQGRPAGCPARAMPSSSISSCQACMHNT